MPDDPTVNALPPPPPVDYVGGPLPQNAAEAVQAAGTAALPPVLPPGGVSPPPAPPQPAPPALDPPPAPPAAPPVLAKQNGATADHASAAAPARPSPPAKRARLSRSQRIEAKSRRRLNAAAERRKQQFHLVILPDGGTPKLESFPTVEELQACIIEQSKDAVTLFPFVGTWLGITRGPWRHLDTPLGRLRLFVEPAPDEAEIDPSGWMGEGTQELIIPDKPPPAPDTEILTQAAPTASEPCSVF